MKIKSVLRLFAAIGLSAAVVGLFSFKDASATVPGSNLRLSTDSSATQGNGYSYDPDTNSDGRYTAFVSSASNLVSGDTNGKKDIFVKDRTTGAIERVSISSSGTQANEDSLKPRISGDGRYVVFYTYSSNLDASDTTGNADVYLYDRTNDTLDFISANTSGVTGSGGAHDPDVSDDGRFISFYSDSSDLVSGDTNARSDVFVRDRKLSATKRISVSTTGTQANNGSSNARLSCDGRFVVFSSSASNLVANDTNSAGDVFIADRLGDVVENLTVTGNSNSGSPVVTCDGRYVAFSSDASNLVGGDTSSNVDVFILDRSSSTYTRASVSTGGAEGNSVSGEVSITDDGQYVAFASAASNLVSGDTNATHDVFLRDIQGSTTERVSINSSAVQGNGYSYGPVISADRTYIVLASEANNLVSGDTNATGDVFSASSGLTADACVQ
jgi:dipeptidyl aminopeptidase/acylaminoacyl peptidase